MRIELSPGFLLVLTGALCGAMAVLALLAVLVGQAYRERSLHVHAASIACALAAIALAGAGWPHLAAAALTLVVSLSTHNLREMTLHVGALRTSGPWLTRAALGVALLALAVAAWGPPVLMVALLAWAVAGGWVLVRAWDQSLPWVPWAVAGSLALLGALAAVALSQLPPGGAALPAVLCAWAVSVYLACVWRSRIFGERRVQREAEHQFDPLTGLSRVPMLVQRVHLARLLMRRFHHAATLMMLQVDHVPRIAELKGADVAESAVLEAGIRLRDALGQGDLAARLGNDRFVVFAEGTTPGEAAGAIAARAIANGLREPLQSVPGTYVQFRVVLCDLPADDLPLEPLLDRLAERVQADAARQRERRIRVMAPEELAPAASTTSAVAPA